MICFPLDNTPYEAKDMGTYLATRTRGVFSSDGNLAVTPGESGLSVSVSPGLAWLKWSDYWGTAALQEQALTLALDTADGALKRIDAIVCRLDKVNNRAEIVVKKGAPSSAPIVVPPVRDANYDELYIATVLIGAGVISISASAITDQRLNEEYCGLMRDGVTGIPTASLHAQAQQILTELTATLDAQIVQQSSEFDAWFEDLKGKLGEDPATALQQQVDNLNAAAVGDSFKLKGNPISIEAAGANRIDSLNLYGENAQGGTTEAPVALTGISSVTVNDDVTELPIPRPLRRVGDVKDKCVTRVKSVYDKRIVLDGTEYWFISKGVFFYKSAVTDNALTMAACDRYKFHITDNGVSGVTTDKTFAFNIATPERIMIRDDDYTSIEEFKAHLTDNPLTVYYQSTAYDGINGLDICLTEYQNGFVELDGTEYMTLGNIDASQKVQQFDIGNVLSSPKSTDAICSHISSTSSVNGESISIYDNRLLVAVWLREPLLEYGFVEGDSGTYIPAFKAYLAAQKEAGTPVQVAYQLATPETYATDPVDFDNTAGPLTVMTGGELEVRMTELVGTRSPELTGKMDRDIYFQVGNLNLGDNTNLLNPVNQQGQASYTGDSTSPYCIDRWRISNGTTYNIVSRTLTASSYANRACGMWQTNELAQQALAIGSTITFSGYINGMQHSGTIKILNRDLYSSFAEVPAGYECDDFEIVCCTAPHEQSKYNLGIYPKKEAVLNWIKWEKGLYATPYAPKGFGLEQLECMRYYQTIKGIKYVLRKALASEGFPYVIPVTFMPMRAVPQTDITVTEGAENNLTATGVTQTACGIQFQPVAENVGLTFTLTLSANL